MKKLLILLFSTLISFNSYGASDEPILYSYNSYDFDNASKYTISNGDDDQFGCIMTQFIFSKEALNALKDNNKEVMDSLFLSDKLTAANILLYKDKVHWVDTDQYSKIQTNLVNQNFINLESPNADVESLLFQLINNNGSTLVCDFPFIKIEVDGEGLPIQTICWDTSDNIKWNEDYTSLFLVNNSVQPFTGKSKCYYSNGELSDEVNFIDGKMQGKWIYWHENGRKNSEENYRDGKLNGSSKSWNMNGNLIRDKNYKDGNPNGKWTFWHRNGQIEKIENYKDGEIHGNLTIWYANGQIQSDGNYIDGKKDGKWINWNQKGQITSEKHIKNGNIISETRYEYHYSNGSKKSVKNFNNNGKKHGKYTSWFKSGQTQLDTNYKDGNEDGQYTLSFEDGRVIERFYIDGECITGDC